MSCMEFRRRLLTDPSTGDADFIEHRLACRDCADAAEGSAQFEQRLREAANIGVPENLTSRILLKQAFAAEPQRPWWRSPRAAALAASVLLVVAVALLGLHSTLEERRLSQEFVALVNAAPYALAASGPVSGSEISAALEPTGLDLEGDIGDVTFAGRCLVRGKVSGHIVVKGESAPVTVFLIKDQLVADRASIRSDHFSGVVLPEGGSTIAIVSTSGEALQSVEARVRSAIRFKRRQGA